MPIFPKEIMDNLINGKSTYSRILETKNKLFAAKSLMERMGGRNLSTLMDGPDPTPPVYPGSAISFFPAIREGGEPMMGGNLPRDMEITYNKVAIETCEVVGHRWQSMVNGSTRIYKCQRCGKEETINRFTLKT